VRAQGYAIVDQELELGLRSCAVPIAARRHRGRRAQRRRDAARRRAMLRREVVPLLRRAADEIGAALGTRASWASPPARSCDGPTCDGPERGGLLLQRGATPFGRVRRRAGGSVRTDDLAAEPLRALRARNPPWTGTRSTT
jgi:hypothetical protein